jgi:hypothetical protein
MLKALVFLSVIVSLAYSAPYGGYGGQSHSGGDLGLGVGFEAGRGLGGVSFGTSAPLAASSSFIDSSSSVVGVGAPIAQRFEAEPATVVHESFPAPALATHDSYGAAPALTVAHVESAPALTVARVESAPALTVARVESAPALAVSRIESAPAMAVSRIESAPVQLSVQAPLAMHEVAHEFVPQTLSISHVETPILRSSGGY